MAEPKHRLNAWLFYDPKRKGYRYILRFVVSKDSELAEMQGQRVGGTELMSVVTFNQALEEMICELQRAKEATHG